MNRFVIAGVLGLMATSPATADSQPLTYDRVHLSAAASDQVENDIVVATLYAQEESQDVARASDQVNRLIAAALQTAKQQHAIKSQTLEYRTTPVYQSGKPTGQWQVRQAMRLESRDSKALSALLGELQKTLALRSLTYELSPELRKHIEDQLTQRAIEAFKTRAQLITQAWGRNQYRLVDMQVSDSGGSSPQPMYRGAEMSLARSAPTIEAGDQQVTVTIQGTIELLGTLSKSY